MLFEYSETVEVEVGDHRFTLARVSAREQRSWSFMRAMLRGEAVLWSDEHFDAMLEMLAGAIREVDGEASTVTPDDLEGALNLLQIGELWMGYFTGLGLRRGEGMSSSSVSVGRSTSDTRGVPTVTSGNGADETAHFNRVG